MTGSFPASLRSTSPSETVAPRFCVYAQYFDAAPCPLSRCQDGAKPPTARSVMSATGPSRPRCTAWCSSMRPASSRTPRPAPDRSCRGSSRMSSTPSSSAASWPMASCGCAAANAVTTSSLPSAASAAASARRAVRGACRRPRRTWWTTSSRTCRYGNGCCPCRSRCACCWPRSPNGSRRCCRWCIVWSRGTCWAGPGSSPKKATAVRSR